MPKKELHLACKDCTVRCYSVFSELSTSDLTELDAEKDSSFCKKGQIIFYEGTHPKGVYVVYSGKVKVYKLGSNAREQIVRLAKPGDILGYRSLIGGDRYYATAETLEDSAICFIPRDILFQLMEKNPGLSMRLMQKLCEDLASAEKKMVEMVQKPVRERMAEALLVLKEKYGLETDNKTLNVVLTREDLANFIGTTTETAIRILSDFKDEKLISLDKKKIALLNIPKLLHESRIND